MKRFLTTFVLFIAMLAIATAQTDYSNTAPTFSKTENKYLRSFTFNKKTSTTYKTIANSKGKLDVGVEVENCAVYGHEWINNGLTILVISASEDECDGAGSLSILTSYFVDTTNKCVRFFEDTKAVSFQYSKIRKK